MYPIGIPALYATILWKNRELLNPRISATIPHGADGEITGADPASGDDIIPAALFPAALGKNNVCVSSLELQELNERVRARRYHPELVPSMFLWKDFGESCERMWYLKYRIALDSCGKHVFLFSFDTRIPSIAPYT